LEELTMMKRRMLSLMTCLVVGRVGSATAQEFTDPSAWEQVIRGTGPFLEVMPSRVTITLPTQSLDDDSSFPMFAAFVRTACPLQGDFDVSVDFHLLVWPPFNGVRMGLNTEAADANRISFGRFEPFAGEVYYTTLGFAVIPTTDLDGSLRQTRSGGMLTTYYKDAGGNWVVMGSVPASTADLTFALAAWSHRQFFADQEVVVAFDNFHVAEGEFPCFPAEEIMVSIDVPDRVNVRSRDNLPVAILSMNAFDATTVNAATVRFGATGTEASPVRVAVEDVNGDRRADLRLLFAIQASGIPCGATSASLTGQTTGGQAIHGSDTIMTTGCN
jgi:hypothetical protein